MDILLKEDELKRVLKMMTSESGVSSLASLGRSLGYKETTFRSAINNNSLRVADFIKAAELMGYQVVVKKK